MGSTLQASRAVGTVPSACRLTNLAFSHNNAGYQSSACGGVVLYLTNPRQVDPAGCGSARSIDPSGLAMATSIACNQFSVPDTYDLNTSSASDTVLINEVVYSGQVGGGGAGVGQGWGRGRGWGLLTRRGGGIASNSAAWPRATSAVKRGSRLVGSLSLGGADRAHALPAACSMPWWRRIFPTTCSSLAGPPSPP